MKISKQSVCGIACGGGFAVAATALITLEALFVPADADLVKFAMVAAWTATLSALAWASILAFIAAPLSSRFNNVLGRATPGAALVFLPYSCASLVVTVAQLFVQHPLGFKLLWAAQILLSASAVLLFLSVPVAVVHSLPGESAIKERSSLKPSPATND